MAATQVVSAACAALGALASANPGCQGELHTRGATAALAELLAKHADALADGAAAEDAAINYGNASTAGTDFVAERAVWAAVELAAGNADVQDAVRGHRYPLI